MTKGQYYFEQLLDLKGDSATDAKEILKKCEKFAYRTVSKEFRLIETATRDVVIPSEKTEELLRQFQNGIRTKGMFRRLSGQSVAIYEKHFQELLEAGDIEMVEGELAVLVNQGLYSVKTGLSLRSDAGKALFI